MTPSFYSISRMVLVLAAIVMQTACVPYVYKHYALVLDDEWSDKCAAKGQPGEKYPSEALGQFWVGEVCLAYRHTVDDLVVKAEHGLDYSVRLRSKADLDNMPWFPWGQIYGMVDYAPKSTFAEKMAKRVR